MLEEMKNAFTDLYYLVFVLCRGSPCPVGRTRDPKEDNDRGAPCEKASMPCHVDHSPVLNGIDL
jgi:hypothetical protein